MPDGRVTQLQSNSIIPGRSNMASSRGLLDVENVSEDNDGGKDSQLRCDTVNVVREDGRLGSG